MIRMIAKLYCCTPTKAYRISLTLASSLATTIAFCPDVAQAACDPNALVDPGRLARNYSDVIVSKTKRFDQLPEADFCELLAVLTASEELSHPTRKSSACKDSTSKAGRTASEVVALSTRYTACVDGGRLLDDCSSEFYRLKSAQSDYQSAIAQRRNNCHQ